MSIDSHYRQAIASVEQAEQLIENPTSAADLDLGEQKVNEAQNHLDALPITFLNDWSEYRYWWYDSRLPVTGNNRSIKNSSTRDNCLSRSPSTTAVCTEQTQTAAILTKINVYGLEGERPRRRAGGSHPQSLANSIAARAGCKELKSC